MLIKNKYVQQEKKGGKAQDIPEIRAGEMIPFLKKGVQVIWQSPVSNTKGCDVPKVHLTGIFREQINVTILKRETLRDSNTFWIYVFTETVYMCGIQKTDLNPKIGTLQEREKNMDRRQKCSDECQALKRKKHCPCFSFSKHFLVFRNYP